MKQIGKNKNQSGPKKKMRGREPTEKTLREMQKPIWFEMNRK